MRIVGLEILMRMSLPRLEQFILPILVCLSANLSLFGEMEVGQKILLLREKAQQHKTYINKVLGKGASFQASVPAAGREVREESLQKDIYAVSDFSKSPIVDATPSPPPTEVIPESQQQVVANPGYTSPDPLPSFAINVTPNVDAPKVQDSTSVAEAYKALYEPKAPERRLGYYFGPFMGVVFPDDLTVDGMVNQAGNGPLFGLRVGRDFGAIRVEGEYSYILFDLNQGGDASLHNFFSRFILENAMGDQADFRAGIGLGLTSLSVASDHEVCFAYDFLLGWSYRFSNFWGLSLDYRHFLTASSQTFSRVQGHVLEVSANFDF